MNDVFLCSHNKSQLTLLKHGEKWRVKKDKTKETIIVHIMLGKKVGRVYDKIYSAFSTLWVVGERWTFSLYISDLCMYVVVYVHEIGSCNHIWCYYLLMPFNVISCFLVIMDICIMAVCENLMQCAFCA